MEKILVKKHIIRTRQGVSLVEVIMVLGISSMMIGGALVWFDTRKNSDFYDQMRQLESRIREVQSENTTSIVPGYDKSPLSPCNQLDRAGCVIASGEEVYGTAVSMQVSPAGTGSPQLKIWYLKKNKAVGTPPQAETIDDYGVPSPRTVELPANVRFEGYKVFPPTGPNVTCSAPASLNGYRNLPHKSSDPVAAGEANITAAGSETLLVFRRTTGGYNAFNNPAGTVEIEPATVSGVPRSRPYWSSSGLPIIKNPAWRGNYDDSSYQYNPSPDPSNLIESQGRLNSQPCAVLWRFGSVERKAGVPAEPRFTAEINFNLVDGTTTLVTR